MIRHIDKMHHIVYAYAIAVTVGLWTDPGIGFAFGVSATLIKDFVWDLWLKRGEFDWLDIVAGVIGSATVFVTGGQAMPPTTPVIPAVKKFALYAHGIIVYSLK